MNTPAIRPNPRICNREAERAAVGHCLLHPSATAMVIAALHADAFVDQVCVAVRESLVSLTEAGEDVTIIAVWSGLQARSATGLFQDGIDGLAALRRHADTPIAATIKLVQDAARVRMVQAHAAMIATAGLSPAALENADAYVAAFASAAQAASADVDKGATHIREGMLETFTEIMDQRKRAGQPASPTGLPVLDDILDGGSHPKEVAVIAARPGEGKSALMLQAATNGAKAGHPQRLFLLEMSTVQSHLRQLTMESGVPAKLIKGKEIIASEWRSIIAAGQTLSELPMWFDDESFKWSRIAALLEAWVLGEAAAVIDKHKARQEETGEEETVLIPTVWIDYLQLAEGDGDKSREREIAKMSRSAKMLAKRLNCAINLVCQLGRASEKENRPPKKSDLRESGTLEQDASTIILLHPKALGEDDKFANGLEIKTAIVPKNRNGETGEVDLGWIGRQTKFVTI